jgi:predicted CXXCH cytochrome family protein
MASAPSRSLAKRFLLLGLLAAVFVGGGFFFVLSNRSARSQRPNSPAPVSERSELPRVLARGQQLSVWSDRLPVTFQSATVPTGTESNIQPADYTGPQSCRPCHVENYESWSKHSHRWMNALADSSTVKGDFSGQASIAFAGGRASFSRAGEEFLMDLERGEVRRNYRVTQTIGSRFFQYYVGRQLEGPEPKSHHFYSQDHVLPFGYWLKRDEWVPIIHIGRVEGVDGTRPDPFAPPDRGDYYAEYAAGCNACHTTFALGDLFVRRPAQVGAYAPLPMHWSLRGYLREAHPDLLDPASPPTKEIEKASSAMQHWTAPEHAVTLGVSCEACHLGGKQHVESKGQIKPKFFPSDPALRVESADALLPNGRDRRSLNWACGRCHVGRRPTFAAGMSTWNSVEYSDAMRGSCYSQLRCVDCHNPHRAIGPIWSLSADQDDAVCLKCHQQYQDAEQRSGHTHHPAGSEGSRCLNCHMPRINEGVEDVVRTHMIYSPTRADMIEANHPNACNLCHTDKTIDWTLAELKNWYRATYSEGRIAESYPDRGIPAAFGWLRSKNESVRLVAAEALIRARDFRALPQLLDALDDPHLVNRQFAYKGLQEMLNVRLADFGYRFYMMTEERRKPLADLRARFLRAGTAKHP